MTTKVTNKMGVQPEKIISWLKNNKEFFIDSISWIILTILIILLSVLNQTLGDGSKYHLIKSIDGTVVFEYMGLLPWFFWIGLLSIISFIGYRRFWHSKITFEHQNKLLDGLKTVEESTRTLPPEKFLYEVGKSFHIFYAQVQEVISDKEINQNKIQETIRNILDKINGLAKTFDESTAHYATNLMIYKPLKEIKDPRKCIENCIKFWEEDTLNNCDGVLFLDKNLSTSDRDSGEAEPDKSIDKNIALPVINTNKKNSKYSKRLLPGAPRAFVRKESVIVPNIDELIKQCNERNNFDLLDSEIKDINNYFITEGIKSFVSIPIIICELSENQHETNEICIGVVNIHKYEY